VQAGRLDADVADLGHRLEHADEVGLGVLAKRVQLKRDRFHAMSFLK